MTALEASKRYSIPVEVLKEYESWELCGELKKAMGTWQYDDKDIELLGMIMTLHNIGLNYSETEDYMRLLLAGESAKKERIRMLDQLRSQVLDEIHFREKQLEQLDYLRHKIRNNKK